MKILATALFLFVLASSMAIADESTNTPTGSQGTQGAQTSQDGTVVHKDKKSEKNQTGSNTKDGQTN